jgi:hypothetical protein
MIRHDIHTLEVVETTDSESFGCKGPHATAIKKDHKGTLKALKASKSETAWMDSPTINAGREENFAFGAAGDFGHWRCALAPC